MMIISCYYSEIYSGSIGHSLNLKIKTLINTWINQYTELKLPKLEKKSVWSYRWGQKACVVLQSTIFIIEDKTSKIWQNFFCCCCFFFHQYLSFIITESWNRKLKLDYLDSLVWSCGSIKVLNGAAKWFKSAFFANNSTVFISTL